VDEWLGLFDDPILGNSALDRLANASYQIVVEGSSYRERLSPHRRTTGSEEPGAPAVPSAAPGTGGRRGRSPVA
jgi:hypothetical protein